MKQLPDSKTLAIVVIFLAILLVLCMIFNSDKSEAQTYWSDSNFGSVPAIITEPNITFGQSRSYDSAREQDEILKRMLEEIQPSQPPAMAKSNECGFFWQGNKVAMDECIQRHQ